MLVGVSAVSGPEFCRAGSLGDWVVGTLVNMSSRIRLILRDEVAFRTPGAGDGDAGGDGDSSPGIGGTGSGGGVGLGSGSAWLA